MQVEDKTERSLIGKLSRKRIWQESEMGKEEEGVNNWKEFLKEV